MWECFYELYISVQKLMLEGFQDNLVFTTDLIQCSRFHRILLWTIQFNKKFILKIIFQHRRWQFMFVFTDCSAKYVTNYVRIWFSMNVCSFMNDFNAKTMVQTYRNYSIHTKHLCKNTFINIGMWQLTWKCFYKRFNSVLKLTWKQFYEHWNVTIDVGLI